MCVRCGGGVVVEEGDKKLCTSPSFNPTLQANKFTIKS